MKKILFIALVLVATLYNVNTQAQQRGGGNIGVDRPIEPDHPGDPGTPIPDPNPDDKVPDEFTGGGVKGSGGSIGGISGGLNNSSNDCECDVNDISFEFTTNPSINTLLLNQQLTRAAWNKEYNKWFDRQKTDVMKPAIEKLFNQKFFSFDAAKQALFIKAEKNIYPAAAYPVKVKYNREKNTLTPKNKTYLKELKALHFRENEIKNGSVNNSFYPDFKIGSTPLKNIRDVHTIQNLRNTIIRNFEPNEARLHIVSDVINMLYNNMGDTPVYNSYLLSKKQNFYNKTKDNMDKVDFLQYFVFGEMYRNLPAPIASSATFQSLASKFADQTQNAQSIEKYALERRTGGLSVFDKDYWKKILEGYKTSNPFYIFNPQQYTKDLAHLTFQAQNEHRSQKARALNVKLKSTSIGSGIGVDDITRSLNITDPDQRTWLNASPQRAYHFKAAIQRYKIALSNLEYGNTPGGGLNLGGSSSSLIVQSDSPDYIKDVIKAGGLVVKMMREVGITNEQQKRFLYDNSHEANQIVKFVNDNKVSGSIPSDVKDFVKQITDIVKNTYLKDKAKHFVNGQLELEKETRNIPWRASSGTLEGNPHLKFTHVYHDHARTQSYFKMTDGSVIVASGIEKKVSNSGDLIDKYRDNSNMPMNERFYYIKLANGEPWSEMLFNPSNLGGELEDLFKLAGVELGKSLGRYVIPIEDVKILIDGRDFDGQQIARWKAAGSLLLEVAQIGKVAVVTKKVFVIVNKVASTSKTWGAVSQAGGKIIAFGLKKSGEAANVLKNARKIAGKAIGHGVEIKGKWLKGSHGNAGFFPKEIADKMRNKTYSSFDSFRIDFWKNVGNSPNLANQFSSSNISRMKSGLAPKVASSQQIKGQTSYVLHHKTPINRGGAVYDVDNLVIVTPKYHKEILLPEYHYGYGY
ncbi:putative HNH/ENDO VII superfamily nuclease [Tenacibaculum sp. 190524A02b]|uniref:hypothetical protein n=1 Tax=Tenacibaculum vairaonense TaxID=3137860 RepID=UPI0032B1E0DB